MITETASFHSEPAHDPMRKFRRRPVALRSGLQPDSGAEIWLVTLSDLLMLLMIFFVVLFGMAVQREKRALNVPPPSRMPLPEPASTAALESDLADVLNRHPGPEGVLVERTADRLILIFPERIAFDPGLAVLKPTAATTLDQVAVFISGHPQLAAEIQGHTDDRPIRSPRYPSNWELSADRAIQVSRALISLGVSPTRVSVKGFGEYRPRVPNDSEDNRLLNRRVEIQFSPVSASGL
jgi:chemotaxis protein MotB